MLFVIFTTAQLAVAVLAAPEQGKFSAILSTEDQEAIAGFTKTLYKGSTVNLYVTNSSCDPHNDTLSVTWLLRSTSCYGEYTGITSKKDALTRMLNDPEHRQPYGRGYFKKNESEYLHCGGDSKSFSDYSSKDWTVYPKDVPSTAAVTTTKTTPIAPGRKRRDKTTDTKDTPSKTSVLTIQHEAPYLLIVQVKKRNPFTKNFEVSVSADMKTPKGYLSAHEYPLLTFYMIMCIIYSLYAAAWLVMSACNFRDLLRVQFWIGGVILLGMIEKAVFYSEYLSVNSTGQSVAGASKFAEVVSAMKRALARMLVIIVSLGFGIVKPRLGPMLHRVIGIGILYFILAVIEALVRTGSPIQDASRTVLFASIPLAIIDSIICWWIFMSLVQTMKTLRLRRNVVKLSLYRHFSNTIIFCVVASLAMIFYSFWRRDQCLSNWQELWIDDAFWHVLFSIILLVIMILWRPNINNQRYAFSPLIDAEADDDEAEEPMLSGAGATETVKMRGLKNASDSNHDPTSKAEEDLQWIEENIPQTVADAALPAIMDSDEEIMATKYEMSKME